MTKSNISITIAFKDRKNLNSLITCIKSFLNQTILPDEIIIVGEKSDLSDINNYFYKKELKDVKIIYADVDKNEARNIGISKAKSKFVMFMDHDMRADKNLLLECSKASKIYDALFIPEKGGGGGYWNECLKLQREFVQYDLDTITPRFFRKYIFEKKEKPFNSDFGELDEWGFNLLLQKKNIKVGHVKSFVTVKDNIDFLKKMKNKYQRGLWLPNFYRANNKEAWRRVDPVKRGIIFYGKRLNYLFQKPIVFVGLLFLKVVALISFFSGALVGYIIMPYKKILKKDIRDFYNNIANSYQTSMYGNTKWGSYVDSVEKKHVIDIWQLNDNSKIKLEKILDLGMGPGRWSKFFIDLGFGKVFGLDISDKMVAEARKEIKSSRFKSLVGDIEKLPFRDSTFDRVFSFRTFKYLPNPEMAIKEIIRVTKKDGKIMLELPNSNLLNRLIRFASHVLASLKFNLKPNSKIWYFDNIKFYSIKDINMLVGNVSNSKLNNIISIFIFPSTGVPKIIDKYFLRFICWLDNLLLFILPKNLFSRSWIVSITKTKK